MVSSVGRCERCGKIGGMEGYGDELDRIWRAKLVFGKVSIPTLMSVAETTDPWVLVDVKDFLSTR